MEFDFCDAHFHLIPFLEISGGNNFENFSKNSGDFFPPKKNHFFCTCAHSKEEFSRQEEFLNSDFFCREKVAHAFGIHPQNPILENADFLEELLKEGKIGAVGETGFDFFFRRVQGERRSSGRCVECSAATCAGIWSCLGGARKASGAQDF